MVLQLSHENESEGRLLDSSIDMSDTRNDDGLLNVFVAHMATDQSICHEFDGRVTWEAVRQHINHDRNVHWRRLLQVRKCHA